VNADARIAELQEQLSQALTRAEAAERELRHEQQATAAAASAVSDVAASRGQSDDLPKPCTCGVCYVRRAAPAFATAMGMVRQGAVPWAGMELGWYAESGVGGLFMAAMSQAAWQSVALPALLAAIEQGKLPKPKVTPP
jgi:multidrug efflux pump subunit AcrA (membrane-fusion protein)